MLYFTYYLLVLAGLPPGIIGLVAKVVALRPAVDAGHQCPITMTNAAIATLLIEPTLA